MTLIKNVISSFQKFFDNKSKFKNKQIINHLKARVLQDAENLSVPLLTDYLKSTTSWLMQSRNWVYQQHSLDNAISCIDKQTGKFKPGTCFRMESWPDRYAFFTKDFEKTLKQLGPDAKLYDALELMTGYQQDNYKQ